MPPCFSYIESRVDLALQGGCVMLQKINKIIYYIERGLFSLILLGMLGVLSVNVILRYIFNSPIIWSDEIMTIVQGVIAFLGIGYCIRMDKHTELSLVYNKLNRAWQLVFSIISNSIMLFCLYKLTVVGFKHVETQNYPLGTVPWLNLSYFYVFVPIGFIIAMIYIGIELIKIITEIIITFKAYKNTQINTEL